MQVELSPDYHQVCFKSAVKLYRLARAHGFEKDLPKDYLSVLERGAQAVLDMTTPSLVQPRFNDCYTIPAKWTLEIAAELFPQRKDFKWAASGRRVDTTNVTISADGRSALADYGVGRKWNLSLKTVEGGKISLASGQMKPRLSGWFVGHANLTVHPATTISVKAPAPTREHRFVTELLPVAAK